MVKQCRKYKSLVGFHTENLGLKMFDITTIISQINKNMFASANRYEIRIYGGSNTSTDAPTEVVLNCSAVSVPGVNIGFTPYKRYTVGISSNQPTSKTFTEMNLTFYETVFEKERKYFVDWMNRIFDSKTQRFNFYKDYVKNITVIQYDKRGNKTYEATMLECFPSNLSPLDKSYGAGDTIPQFNVNIQFYSMEEKFYQQ